MTHLVKAKTSPAVQTFHGQLSTLLGKDATRLSGEVREVNGLPVAQDLRYATPSGVVTVVASDTGHPILHDSHGRTINAYAPPEGVISMRTQDLLVGHRRLSKTVVYWVSRWQKFPYQSTFLVLLPLSLLLMGTLALASLFIPVPHPFLTAVLAWPASVLAVWGLARRHRRAVFDAVVTDLSGVKGVYYLSDYTLYPDFDSSPDWMLDGRQLEQNILDASQAGRALMAMTIMLANEPHRLYASAEHGYNVLPLTASHRVVREENKRREEIAFNRQMRRQARLDARNRRALARQGRWS